VDAKAKEQRKELDRINRIDRIKNNLLIRMVFDFIL
jgi:hypothetical protein